MAVIHPDSGGSYVFCDVANPAGTNPVCLPLSAQPTEQALACLYGVVPLVDMCGVASEPAHAGEEQCCANTRVGRAAGLLLRSTLWGTGRMAKRYCA
jgi:hypothetical protein